MYTTSLIHICHDFCYLATTYALQSTTMEIYSAGTAQAIDLGDRLLCLDEIQAQSRSLGSNKLQYSGLISLSMPRRVRYLLKNEHVGIGLG